MHISTHVHNLPFPLQTRDIAEVRAALEDAQQHVLPLRARLEVLLPRTAALESQLERMEVQLAGSTAALQVGGAY